MRMTATKSSAITQCNCHVTVVNTCSFLYIDHASGFLEGYSGAACLALPYKSDTMVFDCNLSGVVRSDVCRDKGGSASRSTEYPKFLMLPCLYQGAFAVCLGAVV